MILRRRITGTEKAPDRIPAESQEEYSKRLYPHMARYYGQPHDFVIYDLARRVTEIETWFEHNITKKTAD